MQVAYIVPSASRRFATITGRVFLPSGISGLAWLAWKHWSLGTSAPPKNATALTLESIWLPPNGYASNSPALVCFLGWRAGWGDIRVKQPERVPSKNNPK